MSWKVVVGALAVAVLCFFLGGLAGAGISHEHDVATAAKDQAAAVQAAVEKERRVANAQQDIAKDAENQRNAALGDEFRARATADSLRNQVAALVDRAKHPATTGNGADPGQALDLLADLFARSDDASGELAAFADQAVINGNECARRYDALTQK